MLVEDVCLEPNNEEVLEVKGCTEWELTIGSPINIVAYATVDTKCQVLHGKQLKKENVRVSITRVLQGSEKFPFLIQDEIVTVEQVVGTYIAWPRNLIMEVKTSAAAVKGSPKGGKKTTGKKWKKVKDCVPEPEYVLDMGANYPPVLKRLWLWAKNALADGQVNSFYLCQEAFGVTAKKALFLSDVHALCSGGEISGSTIYIFINLLQENLKKRKMVDMITFVDPGMIGALGCGSPGERSKSLSIRFRNAKPGQIFLLPYNAVNHWTLTAVNPDSQTVYHMDPLKRRIATEEWTEVIDNAIKLYQEKAKKFLKKKISWENLGGVPVQTGSKDCCLFIMGYMKEICADMELKFHEKWLRRSNLSYGRKELNEIKTEWAKYFMKKHAT
ncbi:uncharacterized protein LOC141702302 [Apium graveolens]|uniref:uncharacterized protein LOC141702302 n=1 Tax=Apium graveolens TaxID=4045 RepID=UPI003D79020C